MTHKMIPIHKHDVRRAAEVLNAAFQEDAMYKWLFEEDGELCQECAIDVVSTWIQYCRLYGLALRTDNFESIMICRKPGDFNMSSWRLLRSGMVKTPKLMGRKGMIRMDKLGKACSKAKKELEQKRFWHCWMIGTDPDKRGQGFGTDLMQALFHQADKDNVPCYLETVTGGPSEKIHQKNGYHKVAIIEVPDAPFNMTGMLKDAI